MCAWVDLPWVAVRPTPMPVHLRLAWGEGGGTMGAIRFCGCCCCFSVRCVASLDQGFECASAKKPAHVRPLVLDGEWGSH